jgi:hypothetical protein
VTLAVTLRAPDPGSPCSTSASMLRNCNLTDYQWAFETTAHPGKGTRRDGVKSGSLINVQAMPGTGEDRVMVSVEFFFFALSALFLNFPEINSRFLTVFSALPCLDCLSAKTSKTSSSPL